MLLAAIGPKVEQILMGRIKNATQFHSVTGAYFFLYKPSWARNLSEVGNHRMPLTVVCFLI